MSKIVSMLDQLAVLRSEIGAVESELKATCPELFARLNALQSDEKTLEGDIKESAKYISDVNSHTLKGSTLQLVFVETAKLDKDALIERVGQQVVDDCTIRADYWAIKRLGKAK